MNARVFLVRHGEVEHHRADLSLSARGRQQAWLAGQRLAQEIPVSASVAVQYSPITRVRETAEILAASLEQTPARDGVDRHRRCLPRPDPALHNVRFLLAPGREPREPSQVFAETSRARGEFAPAQSAFYQGFWASSDPMGYWLAHEDGCGAEAPAAVWGRLRARLAEIMALANQGGPGHWVLVTHSGVMRVLLRHVLGLDPGEPGFGEIIRLATADHPEQAWIERGARWLPLNLKP
ncbi:MAG: histidine phosphatase family protein [Anaerolineales bacterium]|nr:histidine phosphatase family protein [Anaerolineales bacterium]